MHCDKKSVHKHGKYHFEIDIIYSENKKSGTERPSHYALVDDMPMQFVVYFLT